MLRTPKNCEELKKLLHVTDAVIQHKGTNYAAKIIFKPNPRYHYCSIDIYLDIDEAFFIENQMPFRRPHTAVLCENCDSAYHQMAVIISGNTNEDWRAKTWLDLQSQLY